MSAIEFESVGLSYEKINIKTPTTEQTNTLIEYLTKARMELTKLESIRREEERLGVKRHW